MRYCEYSPEVADEIFDEIPDSGDSIDVDGTEHIVLGVEVVNQSKLYLKLYKKRKTRHIEDPLDSSIEWDKLPERFLEESTEFVSENSLNTVKNE